MKRSLLFVRTISIILVLVFVAGQVSAGQISSSRSTDTLAASIVSDSSINPGRSDIVRNDIAEKAEPGAIGNGAPLMELAQGKLPPRLAIPFPEELEEVNRKVHEAIGVALKLTLSNGEKLSIQNQNRAKQTVINLILLQNQLSKGLYLFTADVRGPEDYLLGFNLLSQDKFTVGLSFELIHRLYDISPERLAQYIFHECVPEKGLITERDDHRAVYNEIQSAVFGQDEVLALKGDLRGFIEKAAKMQAPASAVRFSRLEPVLVQKPDFYGKLGFRYEYTEDEIERLLKVKGSRIYDLNDHAWKNSPEILEIVNMVDGGKANEALAKFETLHRFNYIQMGLPDIYAWLYIVRGLLEKEGTQRANSEMDKISRAMGGRIMSDFGVELVLSFYYNKMGLFATTPNCREIKKVLDCPVDSFYEFSVYHLLYIAIAKARLGDIDSARNLFDHAEEKVLNAATNKDWGFKPEYNDLTKVSALSFIAACQARLGDGEKSKKTFALAESFIPTVEKYNREKGVENIRLCRDMAKLEANTMAAQAQEPLAMAAPEKTPKNSLKTVTLTSDFSDDALKEFAKTKSVEWLVSYVRQMPGLESRQTDIIQEALKSAGLADKLAAFNKLLEEKRLRRKMFIEAWEGYERIEDAASASKSAELSWPPENARRAAIILNNYSQIFYDMPIRAKVFAANLTQILAKHSDQLFFIGIETDIGESQKAQIMPIYKAIDEIRDMQDANGKPLFPNLMVRRAKAGELATMVAELNKTETNIHNGNKFGKLDLNHAFIGARKVSVDNRAYDAIKGEGRAWISAIDDSKSGDYLPVFEAITLNMMAYLNADLTAIKNFYDAISDKPIDPRLLQDMLKNRIVYILPKITAFDTKQLRDLYELAHQVYVAA